MKFKILFGIFAIFIVLCLCNTSAEPELKVIFAELKKDSLKQGESAEVTVTMENVGDSPVHDISFVLSLSNSDIDDIKVSGYNRIKDMGDFTNYRIDTENVLEPGETETATFEINATAPEKEEYIILFSGRGRFGADEVLYRDYTWWAIDVFDFNLNIELPPGYYLDKAEEYIKSGGYENAKQYAEKAKEIYTNSGNDEGILNCTQIIKNCEKMIDADVAYMRAKTRIDADDFRGAASNAELSLRIYNEIREIYPALVSERIFELELMAAKLNKTILAQNYFLGANKYFDSGDYKRAKDYAGRAKEIYLELGESDMVTRCETIIDKSEVYIERNSMLLNIGYAAGIIIIIFIIYRLYNRYKERRPGYSDLIIEGGLKIPLRQSGFSEVTNYSEIPEGAMEPYTEKPIHDLVAKGKTVVKCNECGAYYNKEILEYYNMNCARFGCKNSTL